MKKPVVATDVGGVGEMMLNRKTGFLIKEGDHFDLNNKLSLLFEDENLAKQMGIEGRKFVENTFSWEKIAKNFHDVVKSYVNI